MPYNAGYRNVSRQEICRKLAYVLNGLRNRIVFDDADLSYIVGGAAFKNQYDFVSENARQIVLQDKPQYVHETTVDFEGYVGRVNGRQILVREHVVPVRVQIQLLKEKVRQNVMSENECARFLGRYAKIALITKDQDNDLARAGLRSEMPTGWDSLGSSVFARYDEVGIYGYV